MNEYRDFVIAYCLLRHVWPLLHCFGTRTKSPAVFDNSSNRTLAYQPATLPLDFPIAFGVIDSQSVASMVAIGAWFEAPQLGTSTNSVFNRGFIVCSGMAASSPPLLQGQPHYKVFCRRPFDCSRSPGSKMRSHPTSMWAIAGRPNPDPLYHSELVSSLPR